MKICPHNGKKVRETLKGQKKLVVFAHLHDVLNQLLKLHRTENSKESEVNRLPLNVSQFQAVV